MRRAEWTPRTTLVSWLECGTTNRLQVGLIDCIRPMTLVPEFNASGGHCLGLGRRRRATDWCGVVFCRVYLVTCFLLQANAGRGLTRGVDKGNWLDCICLEATWSKQMQDAIT